MKAQNPRPQQPRPAPVDIRFGLERTKARPKNAARPPKRSWLD